MKKRILALFICSVMIVSCFLTSCELDYESIDLSAIESAVREEVSTMNDGKETGGFGNGGNNNSNGNTDTGKENGKENGSKPGGGNPDLGGDLEIPELDFNGNTYRVLTNLVTTDSLLSNGGENYYDNAACQRQIYIEEALNMKFENVICDCDSTRFVLNVQTYVLSGEQLDLVEGDAKAMITLAYQGIFVDLDYIDSINTDAPYWNQNAVRDLRTSNDSLFFIDGAISMGNMERAMVVFFNEDIVNNYGFTSPYEYMYDGRWTVEALKGMASNVYQDTNCDTTMNIADDTYGYVSVVNQFVAFALYHVGESSVTFNSEKRSFELNWKNERMIDAYTDASDLRNSGYAYVGDTDEKHLVQDAFKNGRALFCTDVFVNRDLYSNDGEISLGVVPMPKADQNALDYVSFLYSTPNLYSISITTCWAYETAIIMEAMAAYGYVQILPAYTVREAISADMSEALTVIYNSLYYDLSWHGNLGVTSIASQLIGGNGLSSTLASQEKSIVLQRTEWDKNASLNVGK